MRRFTKEYKLRADSIVCRDLVGFDMSIHEGQILLKMSDDFVRIAAEILDEIPAD